MLQYGCIQTSITRCQIYISTKLCGEERKYGGRKWCSVRKNQREDEERFKTGSITNDLHPCTSVSKSQGHSCRIVLTILREH